EGMVSKLYDVAVLPGAVRPMALGFKTDEIQRLARHGWLAVRQVSAPGAGPAAPPPCRLPATPARPAAAPCWPPPRPAPPPPSLAPSPAPASDPSAPGARPPSAE